MLTGVSTQKSTSASQTLANPAVRFEKYVCTGINSPLGMDALVTLQHRIRLPAVGADKSASELFLNQQVSGKGTWEPCFCPICNTLSEEGVIRIRREHEHGLNNRGD